MSAATKVRYKVFVLSRAAKVTIAVLLVLLGALIVPAAAFPIGKANAELAAGLAGAIGLLILLVWRAPAPYSNRAYKVIRVRPAKPSLAAASEDDDSPHIENIESDDGDDLRTDPRWHMLLWNIWHRSEE